MFVPRTVHSVVPPSKPPVGILNSSCPVVGAVNATILEGALSNDRLSDYEKEMLKKEDETFKRTSRRRNEDNQLAHALDLIEGLSVYNDLKNE